MDFSSVPSKRVATRFLLLTLCMFLWEGARAAGQYAADEGAEAAHSTQRLLSPVSYAVHRLADHGVLLQYLYVHDLSEAPMGAGGDRAVQSRYSWDLTATIDGEKAARWQGGTVSLRVKQHLLENGRIYQGVTQSYSNIDADNRTALYEAWAQQQLWDGKLRLKAGRIDANTEFDVVTAAADFLNASMGYSPTIMEFSTYPTPHFGAMASVQAGRATQFNGGGFRTSGGRMFLGETARLWSVGERHRAGRATVGYWNLHAPLTRFQGDLCLGTHGFYGVVEQTLGRPATAHADQPGQSSAVFLQVGSGQGDRNPATLHLGAGAVLAAPFRSRHADAAGLAVTYARMSHAPGSGFDARGETVVEGYYKVQVSRTLALVSDVQYFHHPGGMRSRGDTLVATPRLVVSF